MTCKCWSTRKRKGKDSMDVWLVLQNFATNMGFCCTIGTRRTLGREKDRDEELSFVEHVWAICIQICTITNNYFIGASIIWVKREIANITCNVMICSKANELSMRRKGRTRTSVVATTFWSIETCIWGFFLANDPADHNIDTWETCVCCWRMIVKNSVL
jgi:hypothetical protein